MLAPRCVMRLCPAVYRGIWNGDAVAVKVINCDRPESLAEDLLAEAVLSQGLVNPNIVRVRAAALMLAVRCTATGHVQAALELCCCACKCHPSQLPHTHEKQHAQLCMHSCSSEQRM
jgi:hypothetical protein